MRPRQRAAGTPASERRAAYERAKAAGYTSVEEHEAAKAAEAKAAAELAAFLATNKLAHCAGTLAVQRVNSTETLAAMDDDDLTELAKSLKIGDRVTLKSAVRSLRTAKADPPPSAAAAARQAKADAARSDGFFGGSGGGGGGGGGTAAGGANDKALLGPELTPVEKRTLQQMLKLARDGVGENTPAHGGLAIVGDVTKLFEKMPNGNPKFVKCKDPDNFDWTSKRFGINDFKQFCIAGQQDGAMVINQSTGKLCGCNYAIQDLRYAGDVGGGTRHSAGSSMAENPEAGKCFVIVVSNVPLEHARRRESSSDVVPPALIALSRIIHAPRQP